MKSYKYGYDLERDRRELYGEDYSEVSLKALELFERHTGLAMKVSRLNSIIQNSVPVSEENYEDWLKTSKETIEELEENINKIGNFVNKYHLKRS